MSSSSELPTSGALRPGPIGLNPVRPRSHGVNPVAITISAANVEAEVETSSVVDGRMLDPTGPWVVAWYPETAKLGVLGNAVMAGHLDYWTVGAAVFWDIGKLNPQDEILVRGEDNYEYRYLVEWVKNYDANDAPISEIVGHTDSECLTLITCGGEFDEQTREYVQRTVVRSRRKLA
jgi:hypothetical protein